MTKEEEVQTFSDLLQDIEIKLNDGRQRLADLEHEATVLRKTNEKCLVMKGSFIKSLQDLGADVEPPMDVPI